MAEEMNVKDALKPFNAAASEDVREEAQKALRVLVEEYNKQSAVLAKVVRGDTKYNSAAPDKAMADKLTTHLETLGFQISVQSLVCARLDGVDVEAMIDEVESLMDKRRADGPTPWGRR